MSYCCPMNVESSHLQGIFPRPKESLKAQHFISLAAFAFSGSPQSFVSDPISNLPLVSVGQMFLRPPKFVFFFVQCFSMKSVLHYCGLLVSRGTFIRKWTRKGIPYRFWTGSGTRACDNFGDRYWHIGMAHCTSTQTLGPLAVKNYNNTPLGKMKSRGYQTTDA